MIDEILVDHLPGETRAALLAGGRLVELRIVRPGRQSLVGAVIRGRVSALRRDQGAAFVDIGQARAGLLSLRKGSKPPAEGAAIVVQVVKDAVEDKGAGLTDRPAIVGRFVTLRPGLPGLERARRLDPDAFARHRAVLEAFDISRDGFLVQPAAAAADADTVAAEASALVAGWQRALAAAPGAPAVIQPAPDPVAEAIRAHAGTLAAVRFDDAERMNRAKAQAPEAAAVMLLQRGGPLFRRHDVEDQIAEALARRVRLRGGGTIVFDELETLTAIDVDLAAQTGAGQQADLAFRVNLEAAAEIARQLRLRDIGGIAVVDFLRMADPNRRRRAVEALRRATASDPQQVDVLGMTPAGLVELTRKRLRPSLRQFLCDPAAAAPPLSAETLGLALARAAVAAADAAPGRRLRVRADPVSVAALEAAAETLAHVRRRAAAGLSLAADPALAAGRFDIQAE
jgi:ribonuclease G